MVTSHWSEPALLPQRQLYVPRQGRGGEIGRRVEAQVREQHE